MSKLFLVSVTKKLDHLNASNVSWKLFSRLSGMTVIKKSRCANTIRSL